MKDRRGAALLFNGILRYARQFILLAVLSQLFGAATASSFVLALAVTTPLYTLATLGVRPLYLTLRTQIPLRAFQIALAASLLTATAVVPMLSGLYGHLTVQLLLLVGLPKVFDAVRELAVGHLMVANRYRRIVMDSALTSFVVSLVVILYAIIASSPVLEHLLLYALVSQGMCVCILGLTEGARRPRTPWAGLDSKRKHIALREVMVSGLLLGASNAIAALSSGAPQYVLGSLAPDAVAHYAILAYAYVVVEMALNPISQVWLSDQAKEHRAPRELLRSSQAITIKLISLVLPGGALLLFIASHVFPVLFGAYATVGIGEAVPLLGIIVALPGLHIVSRTITLLRLHKHQLASSAISAVIGVAFSVPLIIYLGLPGALWGYFMSIAFRLMVFYALILRAARSLGRE